MTARPLVLALIGLLGCSAHATAASPLSKEHSKALRAIFTEFCGAEKGKDRTPRVCRRQETDADAVTDAERFYTLQLLAKRQAPTVPASFGELAKKIDWVVLRYSHRLKRWRPLEPTERDYEWDANGVPTIVRAPGQLLAIAIEDTNVLLNTATEGEVTEEAIPELTALTSLFSSLGGALAQVVAVSTAVAAAVPGAGDGPPRSAAAPRGRRPPPPPPPPPPAPKKDEGVAALLAALEAKRLLWMALAEEVRRVDAQLDWLSGFRIDAAQAVQLAETTRAPRWWTTGTLPSENDIRTSYGRLVGAGCQAEFFTSRHDPWFRAYLQLLALNPEKPEKEQPDRGAVLAAVDHFERMKDGPSAPCANRSDTTTLDGLLAEIRKSVTAIKAEAEQSSGDGPGKLLAKDAGRFRSGLGLLAIQTAEAAALATARKAGEKESDALQSVRALAAFDRRFRDHFIGGELADWLFVDPRRETQPWDKIGTHPVKVEQNSPFADRISTEREKSLTATYRVKSARAEMFGVATSVIYTRISQPTWGVGTRIITGEDGKPAEQKFITRTGLETRAGQIAILFDWRVAQLVAPAAMRRSGSDRVHPSLTIGAAVDADTPALFLGGGISLARYVRLSVGRTWQRVDRLAPGLAENTSVITSADDIRTVQGFDHGFYVSLGIGLDKLTLFGGGGK